MKKFHSLVLTLFVLSAGLLHAQLKNNELMVPWFSEQSQQRFNNAKYKNDFFQLAPYFQPQINPLYCGIATSVIILNAFRAEKQIIPSQSDLEIVTPKQWGGNRIPFNSYSQITLLNEETDKIKWRSVIELKNVDDKNQKLIDPGVTLSQLQAILQQYSLCVEKYHANPADETQEKLFKQQLIQIINDNNQFIIVNFHGKTIGLPTGGHISPLAAYDETSDSILVLDVAGHKNSWYWVSLNELYRAMQTKDGDVYRGWLVVRDCFTQSHQK